MHHLFADFWDRMYKRDRRVQNGNRGDSLIEPPSICLPVFLALTYSVIFYALRTEDTRWCRRAEFHYISVSLPAWP